MKRALVIMPFSPFPPHSGGAIRSLLLLRHLAETSRVTLVCPGPMDEREKMDAERLCERVVLLDGNHFGARRVRPPDSLLGRVVDLACMKPWMFNDFTTEEYEGLLTDRFLAPFDLILLRYVHVGFYFLRKRKLRRHLCRVVVDIDDVQVRANGALARRNGFPSDWRRALDRYFLLRTYRALRKTALNLVVSEIDQRFLRQHLGLGNVAVVPNVYPEVPLSFDKQETGNGMLFCSHLGYGYNLEGLSFFIDRVLPLIRRKVPDAFLTVIGKGASEELLSRKYPMGVRMLGHVEDIQPFYREAKVAVVPLLHGSGSRIKILEAMAFRTPVVATSIGAEGIEARDGNEISIRDDPQGFADACVGLLLEPAARQSLTANALALVREKYSSHVFRQSLAQALAGGTLANI